LSSRAVVDTIDVVSTTLQQVTDLIGRGDVRVSEHGYDRLAEDDISVREVVDGIRAAALVEDYPDYPKGPCVLVQQRDAEGRPIHVVWGIPAGHNTPAVLVTAYRPDPDRWAPDFLRRKT
jgi:hypothetical protein